MSAKIAVIDTETTWTDKVMSVGVVIADADTFCPVDSRYYLVDPAFRHGGMYSDVLQLPTTPKPYLGKWDRVTQHMIAWLKENGVETVCAYNAKFDKGHMPEFHEFRWIDIMRVAAYRQSNPCIPANAACCRTGRLKGGYGVEPMYRLLSGNCAYAEVHNGWHDAMDELKIMELLGLPMEAYKIAVI